eukprot:11414703-Ditylum_brightwellii.AAC.1
MQYNILSQEYVTNDGICCMEYADSVVYVSWLKWLKMAYSMGWEMESMGYAVQNGKKTAEEEEAKYMR